MLSSSTSLLVNDVDADTICTICMGIIMAHKLNEQDDDCHPKLDAYTAEEKYTFFGGWPRVEDL